MKHTRLLVMILLVLGLGLAGCAKYKTASREMAACPVCGKEMPEGTYCAKCNAVATNEGQVNCTVCGKTVQAGTYCPKGNKFHFTKAEVCEKCGRAKGEWCPRCKAYYGLTEVTYCPHCEAPYAKAAGVCPRCKK